MNSHWTIQKVKDDDYLFLLHSECFAKNVDFPRLGDWKTKRRTGWLVFDRTTPIGGLICTHYKDKNKAVLDRMMVLPKYRRKGICAALVSTCIKWAKYNECSIIWTYTHDNVASTNILVSKGFKLSKIQKTKSGVFIDLCKIL